MSEIQLDIGNEFGRGWKLFNPNMSVLIVAALIGLVVSIVTCGVLGGPMMAGLLLIVRRLQQGDPIKPQPGDIFKGFDYFLQAFLLFFLLVLAAGIVSVVLGKIPVLGRPCGFAISLVFGTLVMWGMPFVVYEKMTAIDAFKKLIQLATSGSFLMPLVFGLLVSLLSLAGGMACGIGAIFTYPLSCCCMVAAYETYFGAGPVQAGNTMPPLSDLRP